MRADALETWKLLRAKIVHEDVWIQHRINWLMATSGLLLAAFVGTLNLSTDVSLQQTLFRGYLALSIPVAGFLLTGLILAGVHGANISIQHAIQEWEDAPVHRGQAKTLPRLRQSRLPKTLGRLASYGTCVVLLAVWALMFFLDTMLL